MEHPLISLARISYSTTLPPKPALTNHAMVNVPLAASRLAVGVSPALCCPALTGSSECNNLSLRVWYLLPELRFQ